MRTMTDRASSTDGRLDRACDDRRMHRGASFASGAAGLVALGLCIAAIASASCTGDGESASKYRTPSATCSDGPRWPRGTSFAYEASGPTDAPRCTPHCGPNQPASPICSGVGGGPHLTSDALPSGACSEDGVVCTMTAEWLGPCPPDGSPSGPLDLFICRCTGGAWACTVDATAPSATSWSCRMPDGSDYPDGGR
jgi:hypothetical protein